MSDGCNEAELLALLDDEYARNILLSTTKQPMSVTELAEEIDASPSTVYRRVDDLVRCGLLAENVEFVEDSRNYSVYAARVERVSIEFTDGDLAVALTERTELPTDESTAERFSRLYESLR